MVGHYSSLVECDDAVGNHRVRVVPGRVDSDLTVARDRGVRDVREGPAGKGTQVDAAVTVADDEAVVDELQPVSYPYPVRIGTAHGEPGNPVAVGAQLDRRIRVFGVNNGCCRVGTKQMLNMFGYGDTFRMLALQIINKFVVAQNV